MLFVTSKEGILQYYSNVHLGGVVPLTILYHSFLTSISLFLLTFHYLQQEILLPALQKQQLKAWFSGTKGEPRCWG